MSESNGHAQLDRLDVEKISSADRAKTQSSLLDQRRRESDQHVAESPLSRFRKLWLE